METRRRFHRRSCPYDSTRVMRSYRSAIVANRDRTYRRFPSGVAMRSWTDICRIIACMLPSSTVENYLKAIYQGQSKLPGAERLVPMGQVAAALGVTPGTATTMVKALAEAGLAEYEPYSGVRLSAAGEKLAGLVLRRHRLVELFLVQVMGMSWAEVHDEAEQLEHVVSERLIQRIDQMLGKPTHDPHGDPIPNPDGAIPADRLESLLTCPLGTPLRVTRIADQDPAFLRFIEKNDLKPGQPIEVEARDAAADSVMLRSRDRRSITIGMRAASKLLVEIDRP
jgi:DtxR family Mn-dependent transcriptional regulator